MWLNSDEKVLRSYLYNTVRNSCLSWLEKEKKIINPPAAAPDKTMLEHMIHAEVMQDIYRHMQAYPINAKLFLLACTSMAKA